MICRVHTLSLYMLTEDGVEFKGSLYMVYGVHDGDDMMMMMFVNGGWNHRAFNLFYGEMKMDGI